MEIELIRLDEVDSTNNYMSSNVSLAPDKAVVVMAGHQTAGRGPGSNTWESEPGKNLLFSLGFRPKNVPARCQFLLSMAGALAVKDALGSYTADITLKWPNDVYWRDKKISGTLIETSVCKAIVSRCIYGIGIDVNQRVFVSDAPNPVSLCNILGREVDIEEVLGKVTDAFSKYHDMLVCGDYDRIVRLYHAALYRRDGIYGYADRDGFFSAGIRCVEPDGPLVLVHTEGCERRYMFKEVTYII